MLEKIKFTAYKCYWWTVLIIMWVVVATFYIPVGYILAYALAVLAYPFNREVNQVAKDILSEIGVVDPKHIYSWEWVREGAKMFKERYGE